MLALFSAAPSESAGEPPAQTRGWISIVSEPPGATVLVDGAPVESRDGTQSKTPRHAVALELGRAHRITLVKDGYWTEVHEVVLTPEDPKQKLAIGLRALSLPRNSPGATSDARSPQPPAPAESCEASTEHYGTVSITSKPYSVVYLGEERLGETPLAKVRLPAGCVSVTLIEPKSKREKVLKLRAEPNRHARYAVAF